MFLKIIIIIMFLYQKSNVLRQMRCSIAFFVEGSSATQLSDSWHWLSSHTRAGASPHIYTFVTMLPLSLTCSAYVYPAAPVTLPAQTFPNGVPGGVLHGGHWGAPFSFLEAVITGFLTHESNQASPHLRNCNVSHCWAPRPDSIG